MITVDLSEAEANCPNLVQRAAEGEEVVIAKAGRALARLVPPENPATHEPRPLGLLKGLVKVPDNFDDPLPDDILDAFYNGPI